MTETLHDRVRWDLADGAARITLVGGGGNALGMDTAEGLREAANRVAAGAKDGSVRVAVIAAEGSVFSVGGDLKEFAAVSDRGATVRKVADVLHETINIFVTAPVPVVSVVHGTAAGGGVGVALAADIVLMADTAVLRLAYTAAGLTPDCGSTWTLPGRIGIIRALDLALTNRPVTGAEAQAWGLVSRAVPADELTSTADELVSQLKAGPTGAFGETKRLLRSAGTRSLAEQMDEESATIGRIIGSPNGVEGVDAFLAKRKPTFG